MPEVEKPGLEFTAHVDGLRTAQSGGIKLSLTIFEADTETGKALMDYLRQNVAIGMVRLPD